MMLYIFYSTRSRRSIAMGGQSAIDAVKSLRMNIISATNGTDYWMSRSGQVMDIPASGKEQFGSSFNQYSGTGIADLIGNGTFTYSGKEDVNGISADVVKGAFTGSGDVSMYFDEAGMLLPDIDWIV